MKEWFKKYSIVTTFAIVVVILFVLTLLTGCDNNAPTPSADVKQRQATAESMAEAERQVGMPAVKNYQERKLAKLILELRDREDLVTYAYIVNRMTGELVYIGQCVGFGLPYSVQFTNPERPEIVKHLGDRSVVTVPQPDPNGLFMPEGLSATWLMMLDPETKDVRPVYVEPQIVVSPFKLH